MLAMHLQCFPPMRYVWAGPRAHIIVTTITISITITITHFGQTVNRNINYEVQGRLSELFNVKIKFYRMKFPHVCIGKPCVCNVFRPRATRGAGLHAHINVTTITNFDNNWQFRMPACTMVVSGQFIFSA